MNKVAVNLLATIVLSALLFGAFLSMAVVFLGGWK